MHFGINFIIEILLYPASLQCCRSSRIAVGTARSRLMTSMCLVLSVLKRCSHLGDTLLGSKCSWADEDRYTRNRSVQQVRAELLGASSIQHPCSVVGVHALLSELLGAVRSIQRPASSIPAVLSELTHCCRNCSEPSNDINQIYVMCLVLSVMKRCSSWRHPFG